MAFSLFASAYQHFFGVLAVPIAEDHVLSVDPSQVGWFLDAPVGAPIAQDATLRRIGLDLHDGPTQLIALALLRLDEIDAAKSTTDESIDLGGPVGDIRILLSQALGEIRQICASLVSPDLAHRSVGDAISLAVRRHEQFSRTSVQTDILHTETIDQTVALKTFAYRFVQECLNNAVKHAAGKEQRVRSFFENNALVIEVCDGGNGLSKAKLMGLSHGFGLQGLRDRTEAIGGHLEIGTTMVGGAILRARIPVTIGDR